MVYLVDWNVHWQGIIQQSRASFRLKNGQILEIILEITPDNIDSKIQRGVTNLCVCAAEQWEKKITFLSVNCERHCRNKRASLPEIRGMSKVCYSDHSEGLQQHSSVLAGADVHASPCSLHPLRTSFWAVFGGFPTVLVMCAAGDGGHATLILLPSSGKYPASLCRTKTTKSWVWLQPPGFSAPTRTCPRVTACCSLLPIYPCMTLLLSRAFSLLTLFSTYERHARLQTTM